VSPRKPIFFALLLLAAWGAGAFGQNASPSGPADLLAAADKEAAAGDRDAAIKSYESARQAAAQAHDEKSEAASLLGIATIEYAKGEYDATAKHAAESLALAEKLGELAAQADALKLIGNVDYEKGNVEGLKIGERVLAIREKLGDRAGIAVALNNLGTGYKFSDPLKEIGYLERSDREFEALGDGRRATVLNNIAEAYQRLGDFTRAIDYCRRALALAETNRDSGRIAVVANLLGVIEMYRGNYSEALSFYERALALDKVSGFLWGEAEVVNNIGLLYQFQRNHPQAIAYLLRALELNRKLGDQSLEAESRNNLAQEYLQLGRRKDAERELLTGLALSRRTQIRSQTADSLTGLARIHAGRGQRTKAAREIEEAIALARSVPDRRSIADSLAQLAFLRLDAGRPGEALTASKEAQEEASAAEDSDALWQAQLAAGKALRRLKQPSEAASAFDAAIATIEKQRARIAGPAESQPLYFADKLEPYQESVALSVAAGKTDEALRVVEQSKSRVLFDVLRSGRPDLDRALSPGERDRERSLRNELVSLNIGIEKAPADSAARTKRDEKRRELEALQTTLYAEHPELAFQRGEEPALPAEAMSRLAAETRAVLLDFFVTRERTYLFILSPGARPRVLSLPIRDADLARDTLEFRRQLASHDLAYGGAARALYRTLLAPAARDLAGATAVVVVPDGPLWDVPFGALQPRPGHFWIEETAISYAPSLGVLEETRRLERAREASPAPRGLLALGNPKTAAPALPEAERQVREIGSLYGAGQSEILVGEEASEHRFKQEASAFQVLHLASHAVLDDVNPMYSHVLLAAGGGDDGLLEARKLMELDLRAEMLVLSGCETARGQAPAGEGVTGMLWAAFVAGAPTTVASLWRVESASTSELMIEFHREWLASRGKDAPGARAQALRAAARKLIASGKYAHPFYWAGFILAGSP
jgi:CHAT domain-containing protein